MGVLEHNLHYEAGERHMKGEGEVKVAVSGGTLHTHSPSNSPRAQAYLTYKSPDSSKSAYALLSNTLLCHRNTLCEWLRAFLSNEFSFADWWKSRKKSATVDALHRAVDSLHLSQDRVVYLNNLARLACIGSIAEADVWFKRGQSEWLKGRLATRASIVLYDNAEVSFARAFFLYRDLRDKFQHLLAISIGQTTISPEHIAELEMRSSDYTAAVREVREMQQRVDDLRPLVYKARLDKHLNHVLVSLTHKPQPNPDDAEYDMPQLLFSLIGLVNTFMQFDPETSLPYQGGHDSLAIREYIQPKLYMFVNKAIMSLGNPKICRKLYDAIDSESFQDLAKSLHFFNDFGFTLRTDDVITPLVERYQRELDTALDEQDGADETHPLWSVMQAIAKTSNEVLEEYLDDNGLHYVQLSQEDTDDILDEALERLVSQYREKLLSAYLCQFQQIAYNLLMLVSIFREAVVETIPDMIAQFPELSEYQDTYEFFADNQHAFQEMPQRVEAYSTEQVALYNSIAKHVNHGVFNVLRSVIQEKIWYPGVPHDAKYPDPSEIDLNDDDYDGRVIQVIADDSLCRQALPSR